MQDSTLKLISFTNAKDKYGMPTKTEVATEIYCRVSSESGSEFNAAQQNGIKPQWKFIIRSLEYSGQNIVEFDSKRFAVYRTYQAGLDDIELYVEEREGI